MATQFHLLGKKRFLPLFFTQFLGAFNDNVFKNALIILITYVAAENSTLKAEQMVALAAGLFILPFFLFSATAGQLSDKHEKSKMIRIIKLIEIVLMAGASIGFYLGNAWLLMGVLFMMGTQSAFFGPLKYSILPDHLTEDELIGGNALIEAGTFLAILFGTIVGGLMILAEGGVAFVSATTIAVAVVGWLCSHAIPSAGPAAPNLHVSYNFIKETWKIIDNIRSNRSVFLSIIGISWFWLVGATFITLFSIYGKEIIKGDEAVVTLFLTTFSIGIAVGSLFCNRLLKGEINAKFVPMGAIGMSVFIVDLFFASNAFMSDYAYKMTADYIQNNTMVIWSLGELMNVHAFLFISLHSIRITFDLFMIAVCGGIYIVPLYAIMQSRCEKSHRARTIAGNNVVNALFMVTSAIVTMGLLALDYTVPEIFLVIALCNIPVALLVRKIVKKRAKENA